MITSLRTFLYTFDSSDSFSVYVFLVGGMCVIW